ncbi:MAG: YifB family Mg chelatase-like AAA ATPase [bacterium]
MISKIYSIALVGIDGQLVEVEVDIKLGLQAFNIVGLAGKAVQEAKDRVAAAIRNSGFQMPTQRITVNLAPANLIKNETSYDLPIAVGILLCSGQLQGDLDSSVFWGELSLDGDTRGCNGALIIADSSKKFNFKHIFLPKFNALEAGITAGIEVHPVKNLSEIVDYFQKKIDLKYVASLDKADEIRYEENYDFKLIKGQLIAKRILEIAASGGHNVLFSGPPGSGKTLLARSVLNILPPLSYQERVEVTKIHSISGLLAGNDLIKLRPFRNPHHTISYAAMVGGGTIPRPGEISLASRGVLFLDEFNEFGPRTLEALRQPLEDRIVNISRASGMMTFPANFILITAMNPCKCGFLGDVEKPCSCSSMDLDKYRKRISGPILDRIDLQLNVMRVTKSEFSNHQQLEASEEVRKRVVSARDFQLSRLNKSQITNIFFNAELTNNALRKTLNLSKKASETINNAVDILHLSARGYFRILKVARTIADLDQSEIVKQMHLEEAISYRNSS